MPDRASADALPKPVAPLQIQAYGFQVSLPTVEHRWLQPMFLTQIRNRHFIQQVPPEDNNLLFPSVVLSLFSHAPSPLSAMKIGFSGRAGWGIMQLSPLASRCNRDAPSDESSFASGGVC